MPDTPTLRSLMPKGYLATLANETRATSMPDLAQVVLRERHTSKYWPAVLALAEKNDPAGFARWAAANPEKLPAKAAA